MQKLGLDTVIFEYVVDDVDTERETAAMLSGQGTLGECHHGDRRRRCHHCRGAVGKMHFFGRAPPRRTTGRQYACDLNLVSLAVAAAAV